MCEATNFVWGKEKAFASTFKHLLAFLPICRSVLALGINIEITGEMNLDTTVKLRWDQIFITVFNDYLCHHSKWEVVDHCWRGSRKPHFHLKISGYRYLAMPCLHATFELKSKRVSDRWDHVGNHRVSIGDGISLNGYSILDLERIWLSPCHAGSTWKSLGADV